MTAHAYYNENNAYAAQWLRNLIAAGHIAAGDVERKLHEDEEQANGIGYWIEVGKLIEDGTAHMNMDQIYSAATRILGLFLRAAWLHGEKQRAA
ncbi:MAG: hypothetical protein IJS87_04010 [Rhodocyclaceae bacterium]|nr:hypothetical protein [Rhodocyclaceae bacterium]